MREVTSFQSPVASEQQEDKSVRRKRVWYLVAAVVLIVISLPARLTDWYPYFVEQYAGDAAWAMMIYLAMCFLFPRVAAWKLWVITVVGCYVVEISQLYQAEWIRRIRHLPGVGLILGYGFLWSDIVAYTVGVTAGFGVDLLLMRWNLSQKSS